MMNLNLDKDYRAGFTVIRVSGDVDVYTAPSLDECIQRSIASGENRLILILEDCMYFDSEGIKVLAKALRAIGDAGRLAICGARGTVLRVLQIAGLDQVFPIVHSLDDLTS